MIVAVESEASSAEIVDIAAARIAAISRPTRPTGRWLRMKRGKT